MMVEVFKTNVNHKGQADFLLKRIHMAFPAYSANFDLEDCDNILRVECHTKPIGAEAVIDFLNDHGFAITMLFDEPLTKWEQL